MFVGRDLALYPGSWLRRRMDGREVKAPMDICNMNCAVGTDVSIQMFDIRTEILLRCLETAPTRRRYWPLIERTCCSWYPRGCCVWCSGILLRRRNTKIRVLRVCVKRRDVEMRFESSTVVHQRKFADGNQRKYLTNLRSKLDVVNKDKLWKQ